MFLGDRCIPYQTWVSNASTVLMQSHTMTLQLPSDQRITSGGASSRGPTQAIKDFHCIRELKSAPSLSLGTIVTTRLYILCSWTGMFCVPSHTNSPFSKEHKIFCLFYWFLKTTVHLLIHLLLPSTNRVWNSEECDFFLSTLAEECCLAAVLGELQQNDLSKYSPGSLTEFLPQLSTSQPSMSYPVLPSCIF